MLGTMRLPAARALYHLQQFRLARQPAAAIVAQRLTLGTAPTRAPGRERYWGL